MNTFKKYYAAVAYIEGLANMPLQGDYMKKHNNPEIFLKRMRYFLKLLGNPGKDLRYIHVTGTSGKGTVTNMIHEILYSAGKKVGSFTSPFVTTSIEKIKVGGLYISPQEFANITEELKPHIDEAYIHGPYGRPSYFEIFMAIALIYFERQGCEFVVLEVGLGGRFDATNIIAKPLVTAITCIDYDHMEILGKTLTKIAYDKAGIIKADSQFFTAEQRPQLLRMFRKICNKVGAHYHSTGLQGDHHSRNKILASQIAHALGIQDTYIARGIQKARLQCRFEMMQKTPVVILDGAHNPSKMQSTVHNLSKLKYNKLHVVIAMLENKDHEAILEEIIPLADRVSITRFQSKDRKSAEPRTLAHEARKLLKKNTRLNVFLDPHRALNESIAIARNNDVILVTGSFFLAGEMRKRWMLEEHILRKRKIIS